MRIQAKTKTIYLAFGNESKIYTRFLDIDKIQDDSEVFIIFSNKAEAQQKDYIRRLEREYSFVTLDEFTKTKKNKSKERFVKAACNIQYERPEIKIVVLTQLFRDERLSEIERKGSLVYASSIGEYLRDKTCYFIGSGPINPENIVDGGDMYFLIDYENVGMAGLAGIEYLNKDDKVILFFGETSSHIERNYIEILKKQTGKFEIVKLRAIRKNGLDFYIAVKTGQVAETDRRSKVVIVTKDSGYLAIKDYCVAYTDLWDRIIVKDSIEAGIVAIDGNTSRRSLIIQKRERVLIETEYARFAEQNRIKQILSDKLCDTEYEEAISSVIDMMENTNTAKERYLSSLRMFGKNDGTRIYRLIKNTVSL